MSGEIRLFVGGYARAGGEGLYPLTRSAAGEWQMGKPWPGVRNASFGVRSPSLGLYYLVDEMAGKIVTCRFDGDDWEVLDAADSGGDEPCHLALDPAASRLACANYGDGALAIFDVDPVSGFLTPASTHPNEGSGPNSERQEGPHAHWTGFAAGCLYQTDLGTDQVRMLPFDGGEPIIAYAARPGTGPRHLAFGADGTSAHLVSELSSTVTTLHVENGLLIEKQILSTLPDGFSGESLGGHIALNSAGDRLYVTNRGHDSVAVFARSPDGMLSLRQHTPSGGASPRFFLLVEEVGEMLIANEEGNSVTILRVEPDGSLSASGTRLEVAGAAFIARLPGLGSPE